MRNLEDWVAVHQVYKQTKSKRETARILGISRNTVKRLLQMKDAPTYNRTMYHSKLDPYKEQIITWLCEPYYFNGTRIYRELKDHGYEGEHRTGLQVPTACQGGCRQSHKQQGNNEA